MPVDTLDDVIEEICNALGIYGAHHEECDPLGRLRDMCRVCASCYLGNRIRKSAEIERLLQGEKVGS